MGHCYFGTNSNSSKISKSSNNNNSSINDNQVYNNYYIPGNGIGVCDEKLNQ